jgi:hypothetical protein
LKVSICRNYFDFAWRLRINSFKGSFLSIDLLFLNIMKVVLDKFSLLLFFLLESFLVAAGDKGGPPSPSRSGGLAGKTPPPPPQGLPVPIDENIFILLITALLFGIYIIYKHRSKEKSSI